MTEYRNAKAELLDDLKYYGLKASDILWAHVQIHLNKQGSITCEKKFSLKKGYSKDQLKQWLEELKTIEVDEDIHGDIMLKNGSWFSRRGGECYEHWEFNECPRFEDWE